MEDRKPTVLVVEDDPLVARTLLRVLLAEGYAPTVAPSCAAARGLTVYFEQGIFDIELRDGSGVDLARDFLTQGQVGIAIFYTGTLSIPDLRAAGELGRVVSKTHSLKTLLELVSQGRPRRDESGTVRRDPLPGLANWRAM